MNARWKIDSAKLLDTSDVEKILAKAKDARREDYVFYAIGANTGLRLAEILHLRCDDFDGERLRITRRKKHVLQSESLDISPGLARVVAEWTFGKTGWMFRDGCKPCTRRQGVEVLCDGGHMSRREVQRRWRLYLTDLALYRKGRGVHALRHYAGTMFYRTHRDLRATQVFLGHSSSTVTEVYSHIVDLRDKIHAVRATL